VNIQYFVDQAIMSYKSSSGSPVLITAGVNSFPWKAYGMNLVGGMFAIIIAIAFTSSTVVVLKSIVQEKELRLREGMQMMGLSSNMVRWFSLQYAFLNVILRTY
jgi:hypothetical protein